MIFPQHKCQLVVKLSRPASAAQMSQNIAHAFFLSPITSVQQVLFSSHQPVVHSVSVIVFFKSTFLLVIIAHRTRLSRRLVAIINKT